MYIFARRIVNITVSKQSLMNVENFFIQVAIFACGGIITVSAAYFLIKNDVHNYFRFKFIDTNKELKASLLPLRLQAHERLIVFIDRINPSNLLLRLHQPNISVAALQTMALNEINAEYQHNIAQQLYVNTLSWQVVRKLKEDTAAMINNAVQGLPQTAEGIDLSKKILQHMSEIEENPFELAIGLLKKEIHGLF